MPFRINNIADLIPFQEYKMLAGILDEALYTDIAKVLDDWFDEALTELEFFSSGSTGQSKSIRHSKESIRQAISYSSKRLNYGRGTRSLLSLPVKYVAGSMILLRAVILEMELCVDEISGNPLNGINYNIDFLALTPFQFNQCFNFNFNKLKEVGTILLGGAPVPASLYSNFKDWGGKIYQSYGMTETLSHVALRRLDGPEPEKLYTSIADDIVFEVYDEDCLVIKAPYLHTEIRTRDHVRLENKHQFEWLGRVDSIINSGGLKINPEYLEHFFSESITNRFFVFPVPHELLGQRPAILVEAAYSQSLYNQLIELNSLLDKKWRIEKLYLLPELEYTATGKLQREASLRKLDLSDFIQL